MTPASLAKRTIGVSAAALALAAATSVSAATLDFVAEAAGNERGIASGTSLTIDGLAVTFSANSTFSPYFDDLSGGRPGGLGVCKVLDASDQCTPSSDDNVTMGEAVTLGFATPVTLSGLVFNDANHNSLATSADTVLIGTNGDPLNVFRFQSASSGVFTDVSSITFAHGGRLPSQFYVSGATATPVPLPAAGLLLAGGLGLLGVGRAMKRRG